MAGKDNNEQVFAVGRIGVDSLREAKSKDDYHKITREATQNKSSFKPVS